ncbi:MAG: hypothetical protein WCO49_18465, partial [Nostocales cyanobacterium ELA608]
MSIHPFATPTIGAPSAASSTIGAPAAATSTLGTPSAVSQLSSESVSIHPFAPIAATEALSQALSQTSVGQPSATASLTGAPSTSRPEVTSRTGVTDSSSRSAVVMPQTAITTQQPLLINYPQQRTLSEEEEKQMYARMQGDQLYRDQMAEAARRQATFQVGLGAIQQQQLAATNQPVSQSQVEQMQAQLAAVQQQLAERNIQLAQRDAVLAQSVNLTTGMAAAQLYAQNVAPRTPTIIPRTVAATSPYGYQPSITQSSPYYASSQPPYQTVSQTVPVAVGGNLLSLLGGTDDLDDTASARTVSAISKAEKIKSNEASAFMNWSRLILSSLTTAGVAKLVTQGIPNILLPSSNAARGAVQGTSISQGAFPPESAVIINTYTPSQLEMFKKQLKALQWGHSFLLSAISDPAMSILNSKLSDIPTGNACEVWRRIVLHFNPSDTTHKETLLREFSQLVQGDRTIDEYLKRFYDYQQSLSFHNIMPRPFDEQRVFFIKGLSRLPTQTFLQTVKTDATSLESLAEQAKAFEEVEDSQSRNQAINRSISKNEKPSTSGNASALYANAQGKFVCHICKKPGHIARNCPGLSERNLSSSSPATSSSTSSSTSPKSNIICNFCGVKGHKEEDCRNKKRASQAAKQRASKFSRARAHGSLTDDEDNDEDRHVSFGGEEYDDEISQYDEGNDSPTEANGNLAFTNIYSVLSDMEDSNQEELIQSSDEKERTPVVCKKHNSNATGYSSIVFDDYEQAFSYASQSTINSEGYISIKFLVDTGASEHMVTKDVKLQNVRSSNIKNIVTTSHLDECNNPLQGELIGEIVQHNNNFIPIKLGKVLQHDKITTNLLSVASLLNSDSTLSANIYGDKFEILQNGKSLFVATAKNKVYVIIIRYKDNTTNHSNAFQAQTKSSSSSEKEESAISLLHRRLGHPSEKSMNTIIETKAISGIESIEKGKFASNTCEPCMQAKLTKQPFSHHTPVDAEPKRVGEKLASDLFGPISIPTPNGALYGQLLLDLYSNYLWIKIMKNKTEAGPWVIEQLTKVKNLTDRWPSTLFADQGTELLNDPVIKFCKSHGITFELAPVDTPQHNGRVERLNRTIKETATAMLIGSKAPKLLWGEAATYAVEIRNQTRVVPIKQTTAHQLLFNKVPSLTMFKVFGSDAWVQVGAPKFSAAGEPVVFVGLSLKAS